MAAALLSLSNERTPARARALMEASLLAQHQADWTRVELLAGECRTFARDIGDILDASAALMALGGLAQAKSEGQQAVALFEEALAMARSNVEKEPRALYMALMWVGQLACFQGDNERAVYRLEEGQD